MNNSVQNATQYYMHFTRFSLGLRSVLDIRFRVRVRDVKWEPDIWLTLVEGTTSSNNYQPVVESF